MSSRRYTRLKRYYAVVDQDGEMILLKQYIKASDIPRAHRPESLQGHEFPGRGLTKEEALAQARRKAKEWRENTTQ